MSFKIFPLLLIAFFALAFSLPVVYAQFPIGTGGADLKPWVDFIVGNNKWPPEWIAFPNIIYYIILPFIAIVAVVYGIMYDLRIFRSQNVRIVLSIAMAGMTLPSGALITSVLWLYSIDATLAAWAFGIVFFVGVFFWAAGKFLFFGYGTKGEIEMAKTRAELLKGVEQNLSTIRAQINELEMRKAEGGGRLSGNLQGKLDKLKQQEIQTVGRKKALLED